MNETLARTGDEVEGDTESKRRVPLAEQAFAEIRRRIIENEYPIGYQALEMDLAKEFGMSRTPIREALIQLEKEGLVEIIPRHGMRVLPIPVEDMLEIFQVLTYLELLAVDLILQKKLDSEAFAPLDEAVAAMNVALDKDDIKEWSKGDLAFHRGLLELAGNKRLADTIWSFWDQTRRAKGVALFRRSKPRRSTENHRKLIQAMRDGDTAKARRIHFTQRNGSHAELLDIIEKFDIRHL